MAQVHTDELGIYQITQGTTSKIGNDTTTWNNVSINNGLSGFSVIFRWFDVIRDDQNNNAYVSSTLITNPSYTVWTPLVGQTNQPTKSIGDPGITFTVASNSNVCTLGGKYTGVAFGNNVQGIWHNGKIDEYLTDSWGSSVPLGVIIDYSWLDAITSYTLGAASVVNTFTIYAYGYTPSMDPQIDLPVTKAFTITQTAYNYANGSGIFSNEYYYTYYGRGIYPMDDSGESKAYFDSLKYNESGLV